MIGSTIVIKEVKQDRLNGDFFSCVGCAFENVDCSPLKFAKCSRDTIFVVEEVKDGN